MFISVIDPQGSSFSSRAKAAESLQAQREVVVKFPTLRQGGLIVSADISDGHHEEGGGGWYAVKHSTKHGTAILQFSPDRKASSR